MRVELVRIGNSRGVRIPKPLIEQCGFGDTVDLRVANDCIVIAPDRAPREGWSEAFQAAGSAAGDELPLEVLPANDFDTKEWQW
ncbi:MAG: AbrB/MazE/SpoVT family DNA-binding domain-containing protein [Terriglobia bacterium]|nr:MAG: AbrB/MazE/SpoVT family DNA-binding domain-containing protein [Terriglobia bacterium]